MPTLIIIRHAKSDWPGGVPDHKRPLGKRGAVDAPEVGVWLTAAGLLPDLALVSSATRTQQTWNLAARALAGEVPAESRDELYGADWHRMLDVLRTVPDGTATVALVAHNPGSQDLATTLAGPGSDRAALLAVTSKYPTAGMAVLQFDSTWAELGSGSTRLVGFHAARG